MRNDLSGSTRVLANAVRVLHNKGCQIDLFYADADYPGFLSGLPDDIRIHLVPFKRYGRRWQTFSSYAFVQVWLFFALTRYIHKPVKLYVNTVMPFGAALAGWFMRKPVIYHVHEISLAPAPVFLKKWLFMVMNITASKAIVVSDYLATELKLAKPKTIRIYNALSGHFAQKASTKDRSEQGTNNFSVLMICSLAKYKGVDHFIALAQRMPNVHFDLLLNSTEQEINEVLNMKTLPACLSMHSAKRDVHPFYENASVLLNLSDINQHIETFGMTVLEGMAYGLPCIVPKLGGVVELIDDQINGYLIDCNDHDLIRETIEGLMRDKELYNQISDAAKRKALIFNQERFERDLIEVFSIDSCY